MRNIADQEPSSTTSTPASAMPSQRQSSLALVARILATAGALLFAVGVWMPWGVVSGWALVSDQRQNYTLALSVGDIEGIFGSLAWSALTVVGVLLLPLIWWRSQPAISYLSLRINSLWVILAGFSLPSELSYGNDIHLVPELGSRYLIVTHREPWLLGFWVACAGTAFVIVATLISVFLRSELRQEWKWLRASDQLAGPTPRPRVALPGASALTIGLALWAVSTFVMPWASVNCNTTPLFIGTCTGLPYNTVLRFGIADATTLIDPLVAQYAVGLVLGGGAVMILVGLWWRTRSLAFCGWATLWLALAAGFAWLAEDGVGVVVAKHEALGLQAGTWVGENAVLLTLLGFILALGGLAYLWVDALRNRRTRAAAS